MHLFGQLVTILKEPREDAVYAEALTIRSKDENENSHLKSKCTVFHSTEACINVTPYICKAKLFQQNLNQLTAPKPMLAHATQTGI